MKFLDINYSDKIQGQSFSDKVNIVLSVIGQGLEVQEQTKLNDFVGGLKDTHKKYFEKVLKSKPSNQEKAIISALLNKYPDLKNNSAQKREFREHLSNLMKEDKLDEGALQYLLDRLLDLQEDGELSKDKKKKKKKEGEEGNDQSPEGEAQSQESNKENAPEGEAADPSMQAALAQDTENSSKDQDLDFYSEWEKQFKDKDCELTEDEFNDLLDDEELEGYLNYPSHQRLSSEGLKNSKLHLAEKFLDSKRKEFKKSKEKTYSIIRAEDFIVGKVISKLN